MLIALIPAAGLSTRMGRPKLALPLGDRTVLERVIDALKLGGADRVLVVFGPHVSDDLTLSAARAGAVTLVLPRPTSDMRATVEAGLCEIERSFRPGSDDAWLLCPADHPVLDGATIARLRFLFQQQTERSIAIPTFEGQRGHPALISWKHVEGIRALAKEQGLNGYLRQHVSETLEVPVPSPEILVDLDTPDEYEQLKGRFVGGDLLGQ
jgi:molybdenum cofactor cytidylyltransferase